MEDGVPEGEHPAVGGHQPVAASVRGGLDAHDGLVQVHGTGGPVEAGVPEGEHPAVGGHLPIPEPVAGGVDAHGGLVQVHGTGRPVEGGLPEGEDAPVGALQPVPGPVGDGRGPHDGRVEHHPGPGGEGGPGRGASGGATRQGHGSAHQGDEGHDGPGHGAGAGTASGPAPDRWGRRGDAVESGEAGTNFRGRRQGEVTFPRSARARRRRRPGSTFGWVDPTSVHSRPSRAPGRVVRPGYQSRVCSRVVTSVSWRCGW